MAVLDILAQTGDGQDFILELPIGNSSYIPNDSLLGSGKAFYCVEIPQVVNTGGGGGNIFIMSE